MLANHTRLSLFILLVVVSGVFTRRCYVCGPDEDDFVQNCDQFNSTDQHVYAEECPLESKGCSTMFSATGTTRECSEMRLNDCKIANEVRYCYCKQDLCNGVHFVNPETTERYNDDEDLADGSGLDILELDNKIPIEIQTKITNKANSLYAITILLMGSILIH